VVLSDILHAELVLVEVDDQPLVEMIAVKIQIYLEQIKSVKTILLAIMIEHVKVRKALKAQKTSKIVIILKKLI